MLRDAVPDASMGDAQHFSAMLGADGDGGVTEAEFVSRLQEGVDMHKKVWANHTTPGRPSGCSPNSLLPNLSVLSLVVI